MKLKNKKILVTGGAGFLGSHLCENLVKTGAKVTIFDKLFTGKKENIKNLSGKAKIVYGDILDESLVQKTAENADIIIHTAFPMAACDRDLSNQHIEIGTVGLFNLLKAAYDNNSKFVYASSISVYGEQKYVPIDENHPLEPLLIYGATKLVGETYCQAFSRNYGLKTVILRLSDFFGPRNGRISAPINFLYKAIRNEPIIVTGGGQQVRTYTYIQDIVDGVIQALIIPVANGKTFNLAGDNHISLIGLAELAKQVANSSSEIKLVQSSQVDSRQYIIDNRKAKKLLRYKPKVSIAQGLEETLKWLNSNPENYHMVEKL